MVSTHPAIDSERHPLSIHDALPMLDQMNGHGPHDNGTGLFKPGERVRLRFVNASAMTNFNVRLPGLPMTVVQADGQNVRPVETDEFQIAVAETYDVDRKSTRLNSRH